MFRYIILSSFLLFILNGQAQAPVNDNCENAIEIKIPGKGFDLGSYASASVDVKMASRQVGERCAVELEENGNCVKTVWYRFYLPTTRDVGIKLSQHDSAIPQIFSGFNVYRVGDCSYSSADLSYQLTPLGKFGVSGNKCLISGWYLIQVGCKKKASGELWINLDLNLPAASDYDHYTNPLIVKKSEFSVSTNCSSITQDESLAIKDSSFTKSIWLALPVNSSTTFVSMFQKASSTYQANPPVMWRIFYGNVNDDSLRSGKPFIRSESDGKLFKLICPNITTQNYIYVQILVLSTDNYPQFQYESFDAINTAWNQPAGAIQVDLFPNKPFNAGKLDFGCMSDLANHSCKNSVPSYYTYRVKNHVKQEWQVDTFRHSGYIVLNVLADGLLRMGYGTPNYQDLRHVSLFEGDIRTSCNLIPICDTIVNPSNSYAITCLKPGFYTLIISSRTTNDYIEPSFDLSVLPEDPKNIYPSTPETFDDYTPANRVSFISNYSSFSKDTSITISNMKFTGGFIYREMLVTDDGEFEIGVPEKIDGYILIFRGKISNGTASAIPYLSYKYRARSSGDLAANSGLGTSCMHFSKGYYTIISWTGFDPQYDKSLPCLVSYNSIYVKPIPVCPSLNNIEPYLAYPIRGNKDVFDTTSIEGNYNHLLPSCKTCNTKTRLKPYLNCSTLKRYSSNSTFHYFTFYISESASIFLPYSNFILFRGDAQTDSKIINDSSRIVNSCGDGKTICNLPGQQVYTLVLINHSGKSIVRFAKHRVSINDFADHSLDLGHLTGTITTPQIHVTCHTNGYKNEPIGSYSRYGNDFSIPFPDTIGIKRPSDRIRSLWFTFTVSGSSKVVVKPDISNNNLISGAGTNNLTTVLKYNGPYHRNFTDVLNDGLDSTVTSMETVDYISGWYRNDSITFYNEGCSENRYFVIFSHQTRSSHDMDYVMDYGFNVTVRPENHSPAGDFCNSAIGGKFTKAGKYLIKADNTCHTYGNSIYEETYVPAIKSSWFVIQVDSLEKFNLGIRNKKGNYLLRYNVYGGSCNGMTRVASNGDRNAYFTLNCLGKGTYFLQAISRKTEKEILEFEVTIEDASNAPCKPYDFKYPIAQFDYKGGCQHNDTITLRNLSTKGEDMEYYWYLNGKMFSTDNNPILFRTDPEVLPVNNIRLIVLNTAEMLRDTFDLEYVKDTTIYQFKALGPSIITCKDTMTLSVSTNYTGKINYIWKDFRKIEVSRQQTFRNFFPYTVPWYVSGESDGCYFKDSILVTRPYSLKKYKDTTYCSWSPYIIKNSDDYFPVIIYAYEPDMITYKGITLDPGQSYTIPKSGQYVIHYYVDKCNYSDTMLATILPGARYVVSTENFYDCNVPSKVLSYSKVQPTKYLWSTGDTTASITAVKSGLYRLIGPYSTCSSLDYRAYLTLENINKDILRDTVLCKYEKLPFTNPLGSNFKVLYKSPTEDTLKPLGPVFRTLRLQRGECLVSDSANTDIFPFAGRSIDSFLCNENIQFSMLLNGGDARSYNWYRNNASKRFLTVNGYGHYPLARIDNYGCKDTLNFNVITNCEFNVFVPNAFTPNDDFMNESFGPVISGRFKSFDMVLFNNWGEVMFQTDNSEFWNVQCKGTYTQGVYGYLITVYDKDNKAYHYKGTVTLLY